MSLDNAVIGQCVGCDGDIVSGTGITVDAENGRWHPECRVAARRQAAKPTVEPPRRGRPPKQPAPVE